MKQLGERHRENVDTICTYLNYLRIGLCKDPEVADLVANSIREHNKILEEKKNA